MKKVLLALGISFNCFAMDFGYPNNEPVVNREEIRKLAKTTAMTMTPAVKKIGTNIYTSYFNGRDYQGCSLVSVVHTVEAMKGERVYNYRICDNLEFAGRTQAPAGTYNNHQLESTTIENCKIYGYSTTADNLIKIQCRTLDINRCYLELTVLKDNLVLEKRIVNTCN